MRPYGGAVWWGAIAALVWGLASVAVPAERRLGPDETLTLTEDLVLSGEGVLDIQGTAEKPCTIAGNGHRIRQDQLPRGPLVNRPASRSGFPVRPTRPIAQH